MSSKSEPNPSSPDANDDEAAWLDLVARLEADDDILPLLDDEPILKDPLPTFPADLGPRSYVVPDDDEDFVPPVPESLAGSNPLVVLAWIGAAGGPIALMLAAIFWNNIPLAVILGIIVVFIAAVGYLIYRLPSHRDHDDGDGAVV